MKDELAKNICRYRKEKGMTQEQLAQRLNLKFQSISKWERAQTLPDISLLPELSQIFGVSIDKLFGYPLYDKQISIYEDEYKIPEYYWGVEPSKMCSKK